MLRPPPSHCPHCGAAYDHTDAERCARCGQRFYPEEDDFQFRVCGTARASGERMAAFERFVATLRISVRRVSEALEVTIEVPKASELPLPAHVGVTLLEAGGAYTGVAHAFLELPAGGSPTCRIPAAERDTGHAARLALTWGEAYQEVERAIE